MPNMCHSHIIVTGPADDLREFRNRCFVTDSDDKIEFTFNAIIPMPEILEENLVHHHDALCLVALGADPGRIIGQRLSLEEALAVDWVEAAAIHSREELLAHLEKNEPAALAAAGKRLAAHLATGHPDWYSWRLENWGTKWPADLTEIMSERDGQFEFRFANPWAFPHPVFFELGDLYPDLSFEFVAIDPDTHEGSRGFVMGPVDFSETIPHADLYDYARSLFGWEPEAA
jgi:hypothetical protein